MPYKDITYTIICPMCNKEYQVKAQAYFRKKKDSKYGNYCQSCRAKIQMQEMTDEQKKLLLEKAKVASKERYDSLSDEDKERLKLAKKKGVEKFWADLSDKERKLISEKRSKNRKEFLDSLSVDQLKVIGDKISVSKRAASSQMSDKERAEQKLQKQRIMERYWNSLSDNDRELVINQLRENNKILIQNMSDEERRKRSELMTLRNLEFWRNGDEREINDRINKLIDSSKEYWNNISDEERTKINIKIKDSLNNLPEDEKERINKLHSDAAKEYWNNLSDKERTNISQASSETFKQYWKLLTEEDRSRVLSNLQQANRNYYNNLTDEDKKRISDEKKQWWENLSDEARSKLVEKQRTRWNNLSDEEKDRITKSLSIASKKHWESLSREERDKISEQQTQRNYEWWSTRTPEQMKKISDEAGLRFKEYRNNLTDDEKKKLLRKTLTSSSGNNKLHQKFESYFKESYISNDYFIVTEIPMGDTVIHSWDYGIYDKSTNTLQMVIDLDGAYYHADNCDYDGLHSKEEYDECRMLSVPEGIKFGIINEILFKDGFEKMIKSLMDDYDEFIEYQFKLCRSMPFPYPKYKVDELIKSFTQLCKMKTDDKYHSNISLRNREGDRIINHFHESIYSAHVRKNISPYEAWYNDELLRKVIENRIIYVNTLNPNKILQGFNISKIAPKVSVFSAGRARLLISRYLSDCDEIFDPFSGFSGRMLGTVSLGKQYIGQDISEIHVKESNNIITFLKSNGFGIGATVTSCNTLESNGTYESLFTCPPYSDKEQWLDVLPDDRMCDDWIDECINRFKCKKYLFVVDNTKKYKKYIVDEISNKSHFASNGEYVILIKNNK